MSTVRSSREFVEHDLKYTLGFVASPRRFNGMLASVLVQLKVMVPSGCHTSTIPPRHRHTQAYDARVLKEKAHVSHKNINEYF